MDRKQLVMDRKLIMDRKQLIINESTHCKVYTLQCVDSLTLHSTIITLQTYTKL